MYGFIRPFLNGRTVGVTPLPFARTRKLRPSEGTRSRATPMELGFEILTLTGSRHKQTT